MFPLLTMLFSFVGYVGAYIMGIIVAEIPAGPFIEHTRTLLDTKDILHGLIKAVIFGGVVSLVTCWRGYAARGGARGVGEGTTRAVVTSSIAILLVDTAFVLVTVGSGR
jgi:phospholipid/cholesterol/gamma-HCH transport system permease protein